MELAFVSSGKKVVFLETSEDLSDMFSVLFYVVRVDENVVQAYQDAYIEHVGENVVHEVLEGCQCIS